MILIILFICVIFVILFIVIDKEKLFCLFTALSVVIFFITLAIVITAGYNAKGGYLTRNKIILMKEKMLREKKEEVLKESDILQKKVECVDHLGIASSSYLSEMIQEIKEVEKEILNKKLQLKEDIMWHNESCNVLIFGLFVIDEKNFGIEYWLKGENINGKEKPYEHFYDSDDSNNSNRNNYGKIYPAKMDDDDDDDEC